ncbi:serine hydrolase [Rubrolithibacter danxiaensis]|uniref:serine hydrolase n=1 Tax=Rubrolithibacter danxiaensis TaxID=3390805 RepID=UPI003BF8B3FA
MKKIILLIILLPFLSNAQTIQQKADELLTAYTTQHKFSGDVLIAEKGEIVFRKAYGYADIENKKPNTLETEFRAGSLTKMFTSTVILQLVEQSKIALTDPVSKYIPDFTNGDKITIKNLLSHTSGIKGSISPGATNLKELISGFKSEPLAFTPGERFEYNNFNYMLLSYIAQKVTGVEYTKLLKDRIFNKIGMTHSGLDFEQRKSENKAIGYLTNPETTLWEKAQSQNDVALATGAGALYTTVGDLYKWSEAISKHTLLKESTYQLAFTPVQADYGLGWIVSNKLGHPKIGHTGSIEGFIADFIKFPKEDITIIYLSNFRDLDGKQLEDNLTALVFNQPYKIPVQKKEISLSKEILERYAGTYQLNENVKMVVTVENGKLWVLAPGGDKVELTAEAINKFYLKGPETEIKFMEEDGKIKSMFIDMQGGQKFTKLP